MSEPVLLLERHDGIARLTLNRPEAMNSIDLALAEALGDAGETCDADSSLRVVLLSGAGRMFSAGGDLRALAADPDICPVMVDHLHRAIRAFARMDALVVVAANSAAGAGFSLVTGADYVVASDTAKFTSAYTAAGLSPDAGLSWYLQRQLGSRRAAVLMLGNRSLPAAEAAVLGLVDEVVAPQALMEVAEAAVARFAKGSRSAQAQVKRLTRGDPAALAAHLDAERAGLVGQVSSRDGAEGLAAFLAKRTPLF